MSSAIKISIFVFTILWIISAGIIDSIAQKRAEGNLKNTYRM